MIPKGLSHYQSVQKNVSELHNRHFLEKIMDKAALYDIAFLQNRALMEMIIELPEQSVDEMMMKRVQKLLSWLYQTQEEATLS